MYVLLLGHYVFVFSLHKYANRRRLIVTQTLHSVLSIYISIQTARLQYFSGLPYSNAMKLKILTTIIHLK